MLVSIVMPLYNCEDYVLDAVKSILNQTYKNIELIICDDASTDSSFEICAKIDDDRVTLIRNDINIGNRETLNRLFGHARGEYIAIMDSDDISHPERISLQLKYSEFADVIFSKGKVFAHDVVPSYGPISKVFFEVHDINSNPEMMASLFFKSSLMHKARGHDNFFNKYNSADRHFTWKLIYSSELKCFLQISAFLYYARLRPRSLSRNYDGSIDRFLGWYIFTELREKGLLPGLNDINGSDNEIKIIVDKLKKDKNVKYDSLAIPINTLLTSGDFKNYLKILFLRIKIYPFRLSSYAGVGLLIRKFLKIQRYN